MRTARSLPFGESLSGGLPDRDPHGQRSPGQRPTPPCEQNHRQVLKHRLPATSFAGGNYSWSRLYRVRLQRTVSLHHFTRCKRDPICQWFWWKFWNLQVQYYMFMFLNQKLIFIFLVWFKMWLIWLQLEIEFLGWVRVRNTGLPVVFHSVKIYWKYLYTADLDPSGILLEIGGTWNNVNTHNF